jgi:SAM-dependent methyltransferase
MLARIKPISELVNQVLDKLPLHVWTDPTISFADLACGGGQFIVEVERRLLAHGHAVENISSRVFGFENSNALINYSKNVHNIIGNLTKISYDDLLESQDYMNKFDVCVGNPPFQSNNPKGEGRKQPKNHNSWGKFADKAINELVKPDGYVAFVTPDSWMSPSNDLFNLFKTKQLVYANLDCGDYFNVGSSFTFWVVKNTPIHMPSTIGDMQVDLRKMPYLPRNPLVTTSIHLKVLDFASDKISCLSDNTCSSSRSQAVLHVAKKKNAEFCYPMHHTNAQTLYGRRKTKHYDNAKIIWTLSGYYKPFLDLGQMGCTEASQYILVNDEQEGNNVLSYMNSKLYNFIVTTAKWSGFLNGRVFKLLPKLENRQWSDQEIYNLFNLTPEEISIVESSNSTSA